MTFCDTENKVSVKPKKKGRPATGRDPLVPVRLPKELIRQIESWACDYPGMDRSAAIRCLLGLGLRVPWSKTANVEDPRDRERYFSDHRWLGCGPKKYKREEPEKQPKPAPKLPPSLISPELEPEANYVSPKPSRVMPKSEVDAAVERAITRSNKQGGGQ